jgi:predicted enzyme related to lactoylglutathione lyase
MNDYDNFILPAKDLGEVKEFYQKIGLPIKFDFSDRGMVAFKVGNQEAAIILQDVKKFPDVKPAIWFVVDDVKLEYQKLKNKGVSFIAEPFRIQTGYAALFEDPSGNRLGITDYNTTP